jgi:hypothetical protein
MKNLIVILGIVLVAFSSCKKTLEDPGGTAAQKMSNEWWVTLTLNGVDQYGTHELIKTYNTASNGNEIWVDDFPDPTNASGHIWGFQVKANADFNNLTFAATQSVSVVPNYAIKVDITEGKVFPQLGRSKSGNVVDSIYMKIKFEDDPTHTYVLSGHGKTGFFEDEY